MEIKAVPSFPNLGVTRDGQVMNMITRRFLKPRDNGHGYMQVFVTINKKQYMRYVHRLVAECYIQNPRNAPEVNHKDGNKQNNNYNNLEWCTSAENKQHAIRIGLIKHNSKIKDKMPKKPRIILSEEEKKAREKAKAKRYREKHLEEILARDREYRRKYYSQHRDEICRKAREKYAEMTDEQLEQHNAKRRIRYANRRHDL